MTTPHQQSTAWMPYFSWLSIALFFFYQYFLRISPGIMIHDLRTDFHMTAEEFATLGSYYLYAYSFVQIPLGIIVDRVGIKKTIGIGALLTIMGGFLMGVATEVWVLQLSRVILGIGSGTAFLCAVKYVADYFSQGQRGILMGVTLTLGLIGAIFAGSLLIPLVDLFGWRQATLYCGVAGIFNLCLILLILPKTHSSQVNHSKLSVSAIGRDIVAVIKNPIIMLYALLAIGVYTPESVLADLWGTGFLMEKFSFSKAQAAFASTSMYLGMGIGSLIFPWLCEKYDILNESIQACTFCLFALFAYILFAPSFSYYPVLGFLIILGLFSSAEMVCFTGAVLYTTQENSGLTIGIVNTLNMLAGAILQQGIGTFLDFLWDGTVTETGIRHYSSADYVFALTSLLVIIGLCCVLSLFLPRRKEWRIVKSAV